jgi:hypothetical protein
MHASNGRAAGACRCAWAADFRPLASPDRAAMRAGPAAESVEIVLAILDVPHMKAVRKGVEIGPRRLATQGGNLRVGRREPGRNPPGLLLLGFAR